MKRFLDYNKNLKPRAKELQRQMTKPEKKLRFDFFKKVREIPPTPLIRGTRERENEENSSRKKILSNNDEKNFSPEKYLQNNDEKVFSTKKNLKNSTNKVPLIKGVAESRGIKIYKQRQIQNFIVDFYIPKLKIVIEIDWETHFDEAWIAYDEERTQILEWLWLRVLRFTNKDIMENFDGVCRELEKELWII
jgi:very-short-patch-repair endonuclease